MDEHMIDHSKDKIEEVTNLQRTTEKYVPKNLFDLLLGTFCFEYDDRFAYWKERAEKTYIEVYTKTVKGMRERTLNRPMDICPYCGNKMRAKISNARRYIPRYNNLDLDPDLNVFFRCDVCGSQSPSVLFRCFMLNSEEVAMDIEDAIASTKGEKGE